MNFNMDGGYLEVIIRGYLSGLLTSADYNNLSQCETDVKMHLGATNYGPYLANGNSGGADIELASSHRLLRYAGAWKDRKFAVTVCASGDRSIATSSLSRKGFGTAIVCVALQNALKNAPVTFQKPENLELATQTGLHGALLFELLQLSYVIVESGSTCWSGYTGLER